MLEIGVEPVVYSSKKVTSKLRDGALFDLSEADSLGFDIPFAEDVEAKMEVGDEDRIEVEFDELVEVDDAVNFEE